MASLLQIDPFEHSVIFVQRPEGNDGQSFAGYRFRNLRRLLEFETDKRSVGLDTGVRDILGRLPACCCNDCLIVL